MSKPLTGPVARAFFKGAAALEGLVAGTVTADRARVVLMQLAEATDDVELTEWPTELVGGYLVIGPRGMCAMVQYLGTIPEPAFAHWAKELRRMAWEVLEARRAEKARLAAMPTLAEAKGDGLKGTGQ